MKRLYPTRRKTIVVALASLVASTSAGAFERDVHFGLTRWLAMKAGFSAVQAQAIAVADERVDAGFLDFQTLTAEVSCTGRFLEDAQRVQRFHFPAAHRLPVAPEERAVVAGSAEARQELAAFWKQVPGKEHLMLGKFGEALHPLQDSWSHQGVPDVPTLAGAACDRSLASTHPDARGGWSSHDADLTHRGVDDVVAMAAATYDAMRSYPPVLGTARTPAPWSELAETVATFARADTKSAKAKWFRGQGEGDIAFLDAITLPAGPDAPPPHWTGDKFPTLASDRSTQFDAPQEALVFVDGLLHRWLGPEAVDTVVADAMGLDRQKAKVSTSAAQLTAKMTLWKCRDHGSVAALAHRRDAFTASELQTIARLARRPGTFIEAATFDAAFYPQQALGKDASPLLPYVFRRLPGTARSLAIARLKHAPHDEFALVVEPRDNRWTLVDVVSLVSP